MVRLLVIPVKTARPEYNKNIGKYYIYWAGKKLSWQFKRKIAITSYLDNNAKKPFFIGYTITNYISK